MTQPDKLDVKDVAQDPVTTEPTGGASPSIPPALSGEPVNVLPRVDHKLFTVMGEAEQRLALLQAVTVDENGVAHIVNSETGVESLLAGVSVDAQKTATLVAFRRGVSGELLLPVTPYRRFGLFVGHKAAGDVSGALRIGLYPGTPLVTEAVSDVENREIFTGLRGIKDAETDEKRWAEEVGLLDRLGFIPTKSRGVFNKFHRSNRTADKWQASPLVALPDEQLDLLVHFDPTRVRINEFQVLLYGTEDVVSNSWSSFPNGGGDEYSGLRGLGGNLRGGPMSYGGESLTLGTKGIGVGFGKAESVTARTTGIKINSLEGAFQIVVIPAQV